MSGGGGSSRNSSSSSGTNGASSRAEVWTIGRVLQWTQTLFTERGISSPRLDAELLLSHALGVSRVHLYTHYDQPLTEREREPFRRLVQRRARREPVAYILGEREFYGRPFVVSPDVLVPRPETEHVVEQALAWLRRPDAPAAPRVLDLCTGSGAIAITLAAELPQASVVAVDISEPALVVARANAAKLGVDAQVVWLCGDLYAPLQALSDCPRFDVIVANPPYVDERVRPTLQPEVRDFEPAVALFASDRGLAVLRRLIAGLHAYLQPVGFVACEIGFDQRDAALALLAEAESNAGPWSRAEVVLDLQQLPRVLVGEKRTTNEAGVSVDI